jgi:indolepyruvate ferredoxin oxidoreductase
MRLSDRYTIEKGTVYLTGIQALVRLPMEQVRLDRRNGLNTGVFISGYEGSPLGGYDLALQRESALLAEHNIHFCPALNEDLAATAVMGSQIFEVLGKGKVDGVTGIWYGKGPGVDRSGDAFRHANMLGCPGLCSAIILAGDDHICKSSSIPHQSDFTLVSAAIPILAPGNTQEVLDYGLYAIALSRYSGSWISLKLVTNACDGGGTVVVDPERHRFRLPEGYNKRTDTRLVPPFSNALEMEVNVRRPAAVRTFVRQNPIHRLHGAAEGARLGIATAGKPYYDLLQALADLGIGERDLESQGVRLFKFGMTWPLDPQLVWEFAAGLEKIIVVEEKRSFLEAQIRDALYNSPFRPRVLGKEDDNGEPLFPSTGELNPDSIAGRLERFLESAGKRARLKTLAEISARPREVDILRVPNYCPGCPHNRSTVLEPGQLAGGGIGCHGMGALLDDAGRGYLFSTQMGGEGAPWIGMAPFVERPHIFQNIGDGTYFHSGSLAVQAAIAAGVSITFKILYNGHVAMTGGQDVTGAMAVPELTRQLAAQGAKKIVVVTEDVDRYRDPSRLAEGVEVRHRDDLAEIQRTLEKIPGVTVLIYDQECAAEVRRRRSRGNYPEPVLRLVINEEVCEGCGDCVRISNCMSLQPVETPLGEKMRIHQPSCNKDYSCALGDCPSFVTVRIKPGTGLRRPPLPDLPAIQMRPPQKQVTAGAGYRILMPGIGGTGVVTVNALLAHAALMDGLHVATLDQTGLAQKGGAVVSHLTLSEQPLHCSAQINAGNADLILGFDLIVATDPRNLACAHPERTAAVLNTALIPTAETIRGRKRFADAQSRIDRLAQWTRRGDNIYVDATRIAERLFGSHLYVNVFLLGVAFQAGLVPVSVESLEQAIRLNGVAVERNLQAFTWGRNYFADAAWVERFVVEEKPAETGPEDTIEWRIRELERYQNESYARRYADFVERVRARRPELAEAVARNLFKLMAYKDEYEVARLLTDQRFERQIATTWDSIETVYYHLHPPLLRRLGLKRKLRFGRWFRLPLRLLAELKFLRGTPLDLFGYSAHRRMERQLIGWYEALVTEILEEGAAGNLTLQLQLASLPDGIRGYEKVKEASVERIKAEAESKLEALRAGRVLTTPQD